MKTISKLMAMVLATSALTACGGGDGGGTGSDANDPSTVPLSQAPALVQDYAALLNAARAVPRNCGSTPAPAVGPLTKWNPKLQASAQRHSDDMAVNNFFSHTGSDGSNSYSRAADAGYPRSGAADDILSRSIGASPSQIVDAWVASPGHCSSVMYGGHTIVTAATNGMYTTVVFSH